MKHKGVIWKDRKRNFLGLPWTFTVYTMAEDRLFVDTGLLTSREDEVRLYRITDLSLTRSLWQRIIGTGTIHCTSADPTLGNFDLTNIKKPHETKEKISRLVEKARAKAKVYMREDMHSGHHFDGDHCLAESEGNGGLDHDDDLEDFEETVR
uniref:PH domain-containing protein n=1 Tax=Eubacterium cellulosolvens TaxID=29322 RepID=UPI000481CDDF|nr:PH domain-containing protein [[Eubacterium] cellulosolvens]